MADLGKIRVTHLGGTLPGDHPLAGEPLEEITISDIRRKEEGGVARGDQDISWDPGESKLLDDTPELRTSIARGQLRTLISENLFDVEDEIVAWIKANDFQIQFLGEPYNPAAGVTEVTVDIAVTDTDNTVDPFTDVEEVTVDITADSTGGGAGDAWLESVDGTAGGVGTTTLAISIEDGEGQVVVKIPAADPGTTTTLGLIDSGTTGLDVSDTADINWS